MSESRAPQANRPDWTGFVLFTAALSSLVYGLIEASRKSFTLDAGSTWTHLIPGMIAAGVGIGLSTPPLAATAVGVVPPRRAGMASGINNTFRQVGLATGIALLGALFSSQAGAAVSSRAAFTAGLNRILLTGAIIALAAGLISLIAIRRKDFAL